MNEENTKKNRSVTSKDVAKLAGVSQSTVSRVFNPKKGSIRVSAEIQARVNEAAKKLGYLPNLMATGMSSGVSNTIGLVVGEGIGPFYNKIINLFIERIQNQGKQCIVFKVPKRDQVNNIVERAIQFRVDGLIITASAIQREHAEFIMSNDIPVILFNRLIPGCNISTVYVNPIGGASKAAELFLERGHNRIGFISYNAETQEELEKRVGFYSKLRENGIYNVVEEKAAYTYQEGFNAALRMLKLDSPPTAIFTTSDLIALGVIDAAKYELSLRIPDDIAVIGYDDIEMASWKSYDLTTIKQPVERLIDESMRILMELINDKEKQPEIIMVDPTLIVRQTV